MSVLADIRRAMAAFDRSVEHQAKRAESDQRFARDLRRSMNQGHDILKLIAKSVGTAGLI